jgi:hypothetical protein
VPDLYQPRAWADGEQITAVNSFNRFETGIDALDNELDAQTDRIDALYAGGGTSRQILSGPSSERPSPAIGTLYYDTGLVPARVIIGTGSSWTEINGAAISAPTGGGGGGGTAPGTSTAPVLTHTVTAGGTIGAINLTWTAVAGAVSYKVYETESPAGVSGATALTTTSSTRTPSTARNYEYWVTATDAAGVESASSNRIQATLPFTGGGTTPEPGGGSTPSSNPSTFLNINGLGNGTGGWWNLGLGLSSGHTDIQPEPLKTYVNSPYYTMNPTGTAVQFQVYMNGGRTSTNTKYPRCELREYATGSTTTKAAWNGSTGRHIMRGKTKVMHFAPEKPEVCVAQAHDASDDILMIHVTGSSATGPQTWRIKVRGETVATPLTSVALGQEVSWEFDINNGTLTVKLNGATVHTSNPAYGAGCYFKVGEYAQQNSTDQSNPTTEYGRCELRDLFVSHS